jgi:hypothetical protein
MKRDKRCLPKQVNPPYHFAMARFATTEETGQHLGYELDMLFASATGAGGPKGAPTTNAAIESFAIHLRNWIDFFYLRNPQNDDITWRDYLASGSAWTPPPISPTLEAARRKANKQIAHLTVSRFMDDDARKHWDTGWANEILSILRAYAAETDKATVSETLRRKFESR